MKSNKSFLAGLAVVPLSLALVSWAFGGSVTVPNEFVAGTPAVADEVNANFAAVRDAVNDNDARISMLEGSNVVHVAHVLGDDAGSGAALITAVSGAGTGTLVVVGPGFFDTGSTTLSVGPGVHVRGAGRDLTYITSSTASVVLESTGASMISDCTIESTNAAGSTVIGTNSLTLSCCRVRIDADGGGVLVNGNGAGTVFKAKNSEFVSQGHTGQLTGISMGPGDRAELDGCQFELGGAGDVRGVDAVSGDAEIVLRTCKVQINSTGGTASGARADTGQATCTLHHCQVEAGIALDVNAVDARINAASCMLVGVLDFGIGNSAIKLVGCYDEDFSEVGGT